MIIQLYPLDYSSYTPAQQMAKVMEELKELEEAGDKLDCVTEETFDVIQSLLGYLITLGINVEAANRRHLEKLQKRHGGEFNGDGTKTGSACAGLR